MLLNRFVKLEAIFLGVIEPSQLFELIVAEVVETRIFCDAVAFFDEGIVEVVEFAPVLEPPFVYLTVNFFPQLPVVIFQDFRGLLQRVVLALNGNRQFLRSSLESLRRDLPRSLCMRYSDHLGQIRSSYRFFFL